MPLQYARTVEHPINDYKIQKKYLGLLNRGEIKSVIVNMFLRTFKTAPYAYTNKVPI